MATQTYHVTLVTADDDANAGTNADVYVTIYRIDARDGVRKATKEQCLDTTLYDDRETGATDHYVFDDDFESDDVLESIDVKASGGGGWKLKRVLLSVGHRTWEATIPPDTWLLNETKNFLLSQTWLSDWMKNLQPTLTIDQLNIPGTHDSGSCFIEHFPTRVTQGLPILGQLGLGVRYFDMRLKLVAERDSNNAIMFVSPGPGNAYVGPMATFGIHHEDNWCKLFFDEGSWIPPKNRPGGPDPFKGFVLQDMFSFLDKHPNEFIVMQVQSENYDKLSDPKEEQYVVEFQDLFDGIINKYSSRFLLTARYPTVQDARGKIVLVTKGKVFNHVNNGKPILNCIKNGNTFVPVINLYNPDFPDEVVHPNKGDYVVYDEKMVDGPKTQPTLYFENHWADGLDEKWGKVQASLSVALKATPGRWVVTYVSRSGIPASDSIDLNKRTLEFIHNHGLKLSYGTVICDYPTPALIEAIVARHVV